MMQHVTEACADALLTACAAALIERGNPEPTIEQVMDEVTNVINTVLTKTQAEGAKP